MASVLITGASKGIGLETALTFARAGHTVHATMRNASQAPELADAAARDALPITVTTMDVDSDDSVASGIADIQKKHGPIDVLVNNAGLSPLLGPVEERPFSEFRAVMETNYFGALRCIQALVPQMRQRRSGCIINVSSLSGQLATPGQAAYCSSKWALEALSEALAGELKTFNVRVAIVEPGIINTYMALQMAATPPVSAYKAPARLSGIFATALQTPTPPSIVAQKILEIADGGNTTLRHLVGPDAAPFLRWRGEMSDEEWVELTASDDETFFTSLNKAFGSVVICPQIAGTYAKIALFLASLRHFEGTMRKTNLSARGCAALFLLAILCGNIAYSAGPEVYLDGRLERTNGRYPTFTEVLRLMAERNVKTIVETGTARCGDTNFDGDGGSTILFGHWAVDHDAKMYSVDISESHINIARNVTGPFLSHLNYVLQDSAAFLQSFAAPIDFLYLDSWDYSETDPEPAQIHNLKEVQAAYDKLHDNSIIMIDDCNIPGGGKGKLAIEYLEGKGWRRHTNRHQVIMLKD